MASIEQSAHVSPDPEGMRVARRVAQWYIGDASWADLIVNAYLHPKTSEAALNEDIHAGDEP